MKLFLFFLLGFIPLLCLESQTVDNNCHMLKSFIKSEQVIKFVVKSYKSDSALYLYDETNSFSSCDSFVNIGDKLFAMRNESQIPASFKRPNTSYHTRYKDNLNYFIIRLFPKEKNIFSISIINPGTGLIIFGKMRIKGRKVLLIEINEGAT